MVTKYSKKGEILNIGNEKLEDYLERKKVELINNQFELVKKYLEPKKGKCILEFGCFHGLLTEMINNKTKAKCIGIDINLLRKLKNLVAYKGKKIPFKKETFDSFVAFEVIEHLSNAETSFIEINRVLKLKGKGIVSTPNKYMITSFNHAHNSIIGHLKQILRINPECIKLYSYKDITKLFKKTGFSYKLLSNKPVWIKKGFMFIIKKEKNV
ncbi:MAG: methyltransferase domain-containing protein [Candidatus Diapherotrites archaeon]|nr:methyltransferase domain-containing protein [Candidatus Diapherotrites archaeon]